MSFDDFIRDLNTIKNQLDQQTLLATAKASQTTLSLIKSRVQHDGLAGEEYSEAYSLIRRSKGRQTEHVDLTFTGRLMTALKIDRIEGGSHKYTAILGAGGEQDKLDHTAEQYGDWVTPTDQEAEAGKNEFVDTILDLFNLIR